MAADDGFTQADRERIVRVEATLAVFMQQVDKRFEQVDKRFEELRNDTNTRFEELRTDMNKRFEENRNDMNTRFEQMTNMFYALSAIFTTLFAAVFGFAWWDRRSILITARKTAREEVEEGRRADQNSRYSVNQLVEVLRSFAEKAPDLKEVMNRANLL
jgi:TolA-binding protein